jgi:signal transduction histidine kinase
MRERLLFIGATLTISSAPGAGTTAEIRLPLTLALLTAEENAS